LAVDGQNSNRISETSTRNRQLTRGAAMLEIENLSLTYPNGTRALDAVNLEVNRCREKKRGETQQCSINKMLRC
jgi:ABC-type transport system involved in cytochrome bd biosynthesis fused ATPase/permease subunit